MGFSIPQTTSDRVAMMRVFFAAAFVPLSIYLFGANIGEFAAGLGLFNFDVFGITDKAAVAMALLAGIATAVSAGLGRISSVRREQLELTTETLIRYSLGFILPIFGATKLLDVQFRLPYGALDTPLGEASGMSLTWRFSGYSYPYELFLGIGEFLGAGLLFFRRTTTLGACVLLAILTNVATLNYTHNIPVKFQSTCYVLMTCYLLALDFPRLSALFLENKGFGARPLLQLPIMLRLGKARPVLKAGFILFTLVHAFAYILVLDSRPSEITGSWIVVQVEHGSEPATTAHPAWTKIFFEREINGVFVGSLKDAEGGKRKAFRYEIDPADHRLTITFVDATSGPPFVGTYTFDDPQRLKLSGDVGGKHVQLVTVRQPH
jgi:hypothetical protein